MADSILRLLRDPVRARRMARFSARAVKARFVGALWKSVMEFDELWRRKCLICARQLRCSCLVSLAHWLFVSGGISLFARNRWAFRKSVESFNR